MLKEQISARLGAIPTLGAIWEWVVIDLRNLFLNFKESHPQLWMKNDKRECVTIVWKNGTQHVCKSSQVYLLQGQSEGEEETEEGTKPEISTVLEAVHPLTEAELEISINALTRTPSDKPMRVLERLWGEELVILIDFESTHNFLDPVIAKRAKLSVDYSSKVDVKIANMDGYN